MSTLYDDLASEPTLYAAWGRVADNDGCAGIDGVSLEEFALLLEGNLGRLGRELRERAYAPQPLLRIEVPKESGGRRPLSIPTVRDRVAQTACALVLNPIFEAQFEPQSHGYRPGRSIYTAIRQIEVLRNQGYAWVVDADIDDFFDEVDHELLIRQVAEWVPDDEILQLLILWLRCDVHQGPQVLRPCKGLPQGSPISPLLANAYLDRFDELLGRKGLKLVRYADDFLVLCRQRPQAERALQVVDAILDELNLRLEEDKTRITSFDEGFRYLGALFVRSLVIPSRPTPGGGERPAPEGREREDHDEPVALPGPAVASSPAPPSAGASPSLPSPFLRTLYLQHQGSLLCKQDERLVVRAGEEVLAELPAVKVEQIIVFGNCHLTTPAVHFCLRRNIPVTYLSSRGAYYGRLESMQDDHVTLHQLQFRRAEEPGFALATAQAIVKAKLHNSRVLLLRNRRSRGEEVPDEVERAAVTLDHLMRQVGGAATLEEVRGHEGAGSAAHFRAFAALLKGDWGFARRQRQPPPDPVNSMLSFGYTLLFYNLYSLLRAHGLNPHVGCLHGLRRGHPALASDLIEEFRAPVVDGLVLSLVNHRVLKRESFILPAQPVQPCLLTDAARRTFIHHFEQRLQTVITHPHTGYQVDWRRCMQLQIQEFGLWLKGERDGYRPMVIR